MLEQPFMNFAFLHLNERKLQSPEEESQHFFFFQREGKFHVAVSMPVDIFIDTQYTQVLRTLVCL